MKKAITADVPSHVPEQKTEHGPGGEDPAAARHARAACAPGERRGGEPHDDEQHEGEIKRCGEDKCDDQRRERGRERPCERRRYPTDAEGPRDERARGEHDREPEHESDEKLEVGHGAARYRRWAGRRDRVDRPRR
jgi:hypothetical protein